MPRPVDHVIKVFGGIRATARALKRDPSAITKWRRSKAKGGTGGEIPRGVQRRILTIAQRDKLDITATDLIFGRQGE